jgi:hypothetical protein
VTWKSGALAPRKDFRTTPGFSPSPVRNLLSARSNTARVERALLSVAFDFDFVVDLAFDLGSVERAPSPAAFDLDLRPRPSSPHPALIPIGKGTTFSRAVRN